jgi:2-oxoglutarate ferredoxin oxidoreductase subunit gamma
MKTTQILIAGFGGQGILFSGKFLAYKGLMEELQVSWLPSYGPEMRGGTANCNVILSDDPVGSPIITEPDVLIAMNLPSLQKYVDSVVRGGQIYVDSSLIDAKVERDDVEVFYIPATQMAKDEGIGTLANMIILGHFLANNGNMTFEGVNEVVEKLVPPKKEALKELNMKALTIGKNYKA